ncbi:MAG: nuclear transport factor 2 family protein [Byssovorax sp.]
MHPNAKVIHDFYDAFGRCDAEAMVALYAEDVEFSDPVFPALRGDEARGMWRMLTARAKDIKIVASAIDADDSSGKAHWDADYTFSGTGRLVHNRIDARFTFRDGKIVRHVDWFDLWKWSGMALGLPGKLLGWSPPLQNKIRKTADAGLRAFLKKRNAA